MRKVLAVTAMMFCCVPGWSADWLTDGGDAQRTGWQKNEKILTTANVGGMKLLWKYQTDNVPRQMHALFPPLIVGRAATKSGPKEIAIVAGVSDNIYALDAATGALLWKKHFDSSYQAAGGSFICPGGLTATPVAAPSKTPGKYTVYAVSWDGTLHQLNAADGEDVVPPAKFMPPNGKPYALNLNNGVIWTMTAQACGGNPNAFYTFDLATQKAGFQTDGFSIVEGTTYVAGGMWGFRGPAIGADGVAYSGTGDGEFDPADGIYGNGILGAKIDPKTKAPGIAGYFGPPNAEWMYKRDLDVQVTPTIFTYKAKEYLVGSSKECRLWLLDTANFGGEDHRTTVFTTPLFCNEFSNYSAAGVWGALSNWVDARGTQWVISPFWGPKHPQFKAPIENGEVVHGAVAAFQVREVDDKVQLVPAWISRDMNQADPPVIANGIVFGYGSGEDATQARPDTPAGQQPDALTRIQASTHAVVYALDGQTGKELWSSGDRITSWNHYSGLSVANGKVYIGTWDGMEYCFGLGK
jgi:outer membrane protein assembly factor BamB